MKWPRVPNRSLTCIAFPGNVWNIHVSGKVHIFWEGHKILRNLPLTFDCSTYSQKQGEDFANFLAFSEYINIIICHFFQNEQMSLNDLFWNNTADKLFWKIGMVLMRLTKIPNFTSIKRNKVWHNFLSCLKKIKTKQRKNFISR